MPRKKIGFIDYYIDNWHANKYPDMIRQSSLGDSYEVAMAWDMQAGGGKRPLEQWCAEMNIPQAASIEQVVESCDCLVVLSPNNGEHHEQLAELPLRSGKPVYIDKPFALNVAASRRMFDLARQHGTPMFSTSALRYSPALVQAMAEPLSGQAINYVATRGPGVFDVYGIHQVEMIVMLMGLGARRIMQTGNDWCSAMTIDYGRDEAGENRRAHLATIPGHPFSVAAYHGRENDPKALVRLDQMGEFFPCFIEAMLRFFETRQPPVDPAQTLEVAAILEAGIAARSTPDIWLDLPRA